GKRNPALGGIQFYGGLCSTNTTLQLRNITTKNSQPISGLDRAIGTENRRGEGNRCPEKRHGPSGQNKSFTRNGKLEKGDKRYPGQAGPG
ncbi:MAG: hypothetical protein K0B87_07785, partial [Candidatus Syntrophosphaera sp.]|nr:hypothetical protein [Candidatus Syntrophosphaera sp.]